MCGCTNVGWLTRLAASDQHCCRYTSAASGQNPVDGQWGSRRDTRNENGEKKLKRWWLTSRTRKENQLKDGKRRNQEMESLALAATHLKKKKRKEGKVEKERECPRRGKKKKRNWLPGLSDWLSCTATSSFYCRVAQWTAEKSVGTFHSIHLAVFSAQTSITQDVCICVHVKDIHFFFFAIPNHQQNAYKGNSNEAYPATDISPRKPQTRTLYVLQNIRFVFVHNPSPIEPIT